MSNNYDYISVSTDSELMKAYNQVMSEVTDRELKLQMAEAADYPFEELATAIRQTCNGSTKIKQLVNKQIKDTRTLESIDRQRRREQSGAANSGYIRYNLDNSKLIDFTL